MHNHPWHTPHCQGPHGRGRTVGVQQPAIQVRVFQVRVLFTLAYGHGQGLVSVFMKPTTRPVVLLLYTHGALPHTDPVDISVAEKLAFAPLVS